jgi:DNA-binding NarL/FixJ family response regulator
VRTSVGVAEVREAWRASPDRPVVALTDDSDFDLVAETLRAGATSVISWDRDVRVLLSAMELAAEGLSSIETPMLGQLVSHAANPSTITDAECSWLGHLDRGLTIAELAPLAGYSERSLYRQLNGLYHRLGVHDRAGAIAEARRRGLL